MSMESILLIRRSARQGDSRSVQWSFPGGQRDLGDPDLMHNALRELEEECGTRLGREHSEAILPPVLARRRTGPFVLVAPFAFGVDGELRHVIGFFKASEKFMSPVCLQGKCPCLIPR
jgi:8-oxo-dGTP pyrophosphatase MutT (NUDIX family)